MTVYLHDAVAYSHRPDLEAGGYLGGNKVFLLKGYAVGNNLQTTRQCQYQQLMPTDGTHVRNSTK